jgi:hypothetical protein
MAANSRLWLTLLLAAPAGAEIRVTPWQPVFEGVERASGEAKADDGRPQRAVAVRIDLRARGLEFITTEGNGDKPGETNGETATEFARRHGLQVAINANLFSPCCAEGGKDLGGLAISRGEVVSPPVRLGPGDCVLAITRDNRAVITRSGEDFNVADYWTAVAGSGIIVTNGRNVANRNDAGGGRSHPRTAVGLDAEGRHLLLLVIDGRKSGRSEGATLVELAEWLLHLGAHEALNLDGGGSTTLVIEQDGRKVVANEPSDGGWLPLFGRTAAAREAAQRINGNHLGVRALPPTVR